MTWQSMSSLVKYNVFWKYSLTGYSFSNPLQVLLKQKVDSN
jgi:hypothetical protein